MRRRTRTRETALVLTGLLGCAAVTAGVMAGPAASPASTTVTTHAAARPALTLAVVRDRLSALEQDADRAGRDAQVADEALLQHRTGATTAAAEHAHAALVALSAAQTPELTRLATRAAALGASSAMSGSAGATAETAALVGRTRAIRAVSFARAQLGDPYGYAKAGPRRWDCSGLTMKSYGAVRIGIGGHSANAQWRKAKQQHRLVSFGKRRVGDLIFYGRPGAVYHVAIYSGHGRMIEAPYPGKRVREVSVRSGGRLGQVARPA